MTGIVSESAKHSRPRPKQAAIIEDIRSQIIAGKLSPGVQLPTVASMQKLYGASDTTVQSAVRYLREQGFIQTRKRNGMFVADHPPHLSHFGIVYPHAPTESQYEYAIRKEIERLSNTTSASGIQRRFSIFHYADHYDTEVQQHTRLVKAVSNDSLAGLIFPWPPHFLHRVVQGNPSIPCVSYCDHPVSGTTPNTSSFARTFCKRASALSAFCGGWNSTASCIFSGTSAA